MKTKTTYENLTPLEVAQIGEESGWPVEGLAVSDDDRGPVNMKIRSVKIGERHPFCTLPHDDHFKHCARPVETIEWEVGDLVETKTGVAKGRIQSVQSPNHVTIVNAANDGTTSLCYAKKIKPWQPGYGYTTGGELIVAPDGWEIVPEEYSGIAEIAFHNSEWKPTFQGECVKARANFGTRAYARRIDTIAPGHNPAGLTVSQVGEGWRLLSREEIAEREPTEEISAWSKCLKEWNEFGTRSGEDLSITYRTHRPNGYFLPKPERDNFAKIRAFLTKHNADEIEWDAIDEIESDDAQQSAVNSELADGKNPVCPDQNSVRKFDEWWHTIGSGIRPLSNEDTEEFARRITRERDWLEIQEHISLLRRYNKLRRCGDWKHYQSTATGIAIDMVLDALEEKINREQSKHEQNSKSSD